MILHSLTLTNFGLYAGENRFNLSPDTETGKPVILVRGHNGGGKTTFLEAIRLALYGKRALGVRVSRSDYEAHLINRINLHSKESSASICLSFNCLEEGLNTSYQVERIWDKQENSIFETMNLIRNGQTFSDIPKESWDHFLENLIPSGISQLFFFDGEKIQNIADDSTTDALRDSIRGLLGLDLINQLRSDLTLYTARRNSCDDSHELEVIEREIKGIRDDLMLLEEDAAQIRADHLLAERRLQKAQRKFEAEGGTAALNRSGLKQMLNEVDKQIIWLRSDLKRLAESSLPLSLAPKMLKKLQTAINKQRVSVGNKIIDEFITDFELSKQPQISKSPSWTQSHFKALRSFLRTENEDACGLQFDADPTWIESRLQGIDSDLKVQALELSKSLDKALKHKEKLKHQLKTLDEDAANESLNALREAEFQRGRSETLLKDKEEIISSLRNKISKLEVDRERAIDITFDNSLALHKVELGERVRAALSEYELRILDRRIETLSGHFTECFNNLISKKRFLKGILINPKSFEFTLLSVDGNEIPKSLLSAGERQIFAISMLWALGKTSGRNLPIIIDTPLSRLDRTHRKALMRDYVPVASSQVIMLCTDSELTPDLDKLISPHVARRYEISVTGNKLKTDIDEKITDLVYAH